MNISYEQDLLDRLHVGVDSDGQIFTWKSLKVFITKRQSCLFSKKIWKLTDFTDFRKSTFITRFNFDPFGGIEIPWKELHEEAKKIDATNDHNN